MSNAGTLDIRIRDKDYQVACSDEERATLEAAVLLLNQRMDEIADKTRSNGERLAVMTALNLAYDVLALQAGKPPAQRPIGDVDAPSIKRRIATIEAKLDATLAAQKQDDLFQS
ncbi:MAG: cell division protein ZapA [Rhodocyclaceae bacterium]|jgi:cell division protein ZapA|nr:cell division protein ZapA [Rhodocyclaceae bacterium]